MKLLAWGAAGLWAETVCSTTPGHPSCQWVYENGGPKLECEWIPDQTECWYVAPPEVDLGEELDDIPCDEECFTYEVYEGPQACDPPGCNPDDYVCIETQCESVCGTS